MSQAGASVGEAPAGIANRHVTKESHYAPA